MGSTFLNPTYFGDDGQPVGVATQVFLPEYMDWQPILLKAFWFTSRGFGEPKATHVLLRSQGEQMLVPISTPLQHLDYKTLQEIDNGLEKLVNDFAREKGINRTPRNQ